MARLYSVSRLLRVLTASREAWTDLDTTLLHAKHTIAFAKLFPAAFRSARILECGIVADTVEHSRECGFETFEQLVAYTCETKSTRSDSESAPTRSSMDYCVPNVRTRRMYFTNLSGTHVEAMSRLFPALVHLHLTARMSTISLAVRQLRHLFDCLPHLRYLRCGSITRDSDSDGSPLKKLVLPNRLVEFTCAAFFRYVSAIGLHRRC